MANKADRVYYENFIEAADYCYQAADYLAKCLMDYHPEEVKNMLDKMHDIEHAADGKKHEMSAALAKAFVTPIDREDLAALSQEIDDVTDKVEEIMQRFYVDEIQTVTEDCITFAHKLTVCCSLMRDMIADLKNFKKPDRLRKLAIAVGDAEEECDDFYLDVTLKTRRQFTDAMDIITWRAIYDQMEECADACAHVADMVETIVMKNT